MCPGLELNHALWSPAVCSRANIQRAECALELRRAGMDVNAWFKEYGTSSFDVISTDDIVHRMNIAPDPDTNGLLQTISFPGMQ